MSTKQDKHEKDLEGFLKKINDVDSIIKQLSCADADESVKRDALQRADDYLNRAKAETGGFDRSVINKIEDDATSGVSREEISAEDFMKEVEDDSKKRAEKKKINKEKSLVWKEKGNTLFKEEKYADAAECYSEAIKLTPDDVIFYCNRAQAFIKLEGYDSALTDCETAIKLNKYFAKIYYQQGRALTGLKRYEEAIASFNHVLKIDKKQQSIVTEYINDVEKKKKLNLDEEKAFALLESGDDVLHEIKSLVSRLRKGSPADIWKGNDVIVKLKKLIVDENHSTIFRTSKGFNIITEHPALNKLMKKIPHSPEEMKVVVNIIGLFSNTIICSEENCNILCSMGCVLDAAMECLNTENGLNEEFEAVQLFYRISQFDDPRKILLANDSITLFLDRAIVILGKGGDLALIAMGTINNLALDKSFVPKFEQKLSTDFIPGVIKMMKLLSLTSPDITLTNKFLPVLASSISTVGNLFQDDDLRKKKDIFEKMWTASVQLLRRYSRKLDDKNILKVIQATLGMLMNLSNQKTVFNEEHSTEWVTLSVTLIKSSDPVVVERCCGILGHILPHNEPMVKEIVNNQIYLHFLKVMKGDNDAAKRHIIKTIAICMILDPRVIESISTDNVTPSIFKCLDSSDEYVIGNTALILLQCHTNNSVVSQVASNKEVIKKLLVHADNEQFSTTVRHNCAIAVGRYVDKDPRCLQQLRDLNGLDILKELVKDRYTFHY